MYKYVPARIALQGCHSATVLPIPCIIPRTKQDVNYNIARSAKITVLTITKIIEYEVVLTALKLDIDS